ncbi:MAG TPA: SRPBCC family protein [Gemmatimonadaceae bacterium]|nr:SRPBCC family protein [Gemmatimonadaceae bacterium]
MQIDVKSEHPLTDANVKATTGQSFDDWFRELDASGGPTPGRRAITGRLMEERGLAAWWAQTIAVEYERARSVHEKDGRPKGYSICVTKTIVAPADRIFDAFGDARLMSTWLGKGAKAELAEGASFSTADGNRGRYTKVARPKTLRFSWDDDDPSASSTVELKLTPNGPKCGLVLNHERIQSRAHADGLRAAWGAAIEKLKQTLE